MQFRHKRLRIKIEAEIIQTAGELMTPQGKRTYQSGDAIIHRDQQRFVMDGKKFAQIYEAL